MKLPSQLFRHSDQADRNMKSILRKRKRKSRSLEAEVRAMHIAADIEKLKSYSETKTESGRNDGKGSH